MATRNVFFYEIRPTRKKDVEWRLDVPALIAALDALPDSDRIRQVDQGPGDIYEFVQVIHSGTNPAIAYVRCREHGLPMLAEQATLEPLDIAVEKKLAELTHAVFFGHHIIGAEYNHYGPGLTSIAAYLADKVPEFLPDNRRVLIASLVNADRMSLLRSSRSISAISMTMAPQLLDSVEALQHLTGRDALRHMSAGYGAQKIGLNMNNRDGLSKLEVVGLLNWAFEQGSGLLSSAIAQVELEDGTRHRINLLKNRIGMEREMELMGPNARSVAHESARIQILGAFDSLGKQLKEASTLWGVEP